MQRLEELTLDGKVIDMAKHFETPLSIQYKVTCAVCPTTGVWLTGGKVRTKRLAGGCGICGAGFTTFLIRIYVAPDAYNCVSANRMLHKQAHQG